MHARFLTEPLHFGNMGLSKACFGVHLHSATTCGDGCMHACARLHVPDAMMALQCSTLHAMPSWLGHMPTAVFRMQSHGSYGLIIPYIRCLTYRMAAKQFTSCPGKLLNISLS